VKLAFERSEDVSNEVIGIIARVSESFLTFWNHSQVSEEKGREGNSVNNLINKVDSTKGQQFERIRV